MPVLPHSTLHVGGRDGCGEAADGVAYGQVPCISSRKVQTHILRGARAQLPRWVAAPASHEAAPRQQAVPVSTPAQCHDRVEGGVRGREDVVHEPRPLCREGPRHHLVPHRTVLARHILNERLFVHDNRQRGLIHQLNVLVGLVGAAVPIAAVPAIAPALCRANVIGQHRAAVNAATGQPRHRLGEEHGPHDVGRRFIVADGVIFSGIRPVPTLAVVVGAPAHDLPMPHHHTGVVPPHRHTSRLTQWQGHGAKAVQVPGAPVQCRGAAQARHACRLVTHRRRTGEAQAKLAVGVVAPAPHRPISSDGTAVLSQGHGDHRERAQVKVVVVASELGRGVAGGVLARHSVHCRAPALDCPRREQGAHDPPRDGGEDAQHGAVQGDHGGGRASVAQGLHIHSTSVTQAARGVLPPARHLTRRQQSAVRVPARRSLQGHDALGAGVLADTRWAAG